VAWSSATGQDWVGKCDFAAHTPEYYSHGGNCGVDLNRRPATDLFVKGGSSRTRLHRYSTMQRAMPSIPIRQLASSRSPGSSSTSGPIPS